MLDAGPPLLRRSTIVHFLSDPAEATRVTSQSARYKVRVGLSHATVRDYCESLDVLPQITGRDGDLKNVQRPWAVKAVLASVPPPARVLEIGGGEPIVSGLLSDLGYEATLIDPYDGFGNGPTEYATYVERFPGVRIVRDYLARETTPFGRATFDVVLSVSVLEHIRLEPLESCFGAIAELLMPNGASIHCFDFVMEGVGQEYALENARQILRLQAGLAGAPENNTDGLPAHLEVVRSDLETFYLSPQGHAGWRGQQPYDAFPFRKVISLQTIVLKGDTQPFEMLAAC